MGDEGVDEHVAGAGIEGEYLRRLSVGGNDGDVGDAADVERDAAEFGMAVEGVVGEWDEWRAIAAESEVGGAEVRDGGDAGASGDDGAFADLESGSGWRAEVRNWRALMKNGLAVVADEIDFARRDAEFFVGGKGGFGVDVAEAEVELAQFAGGDGILF